MHRDHNIFTEAVDKQRKIRLLFIDNDGQWQAMLVIPLDYTPRRRATGKSSCYHFWDLKVGANGSPLILLTNQIQNMEMDAGTFCPDDFIKVVLEHSKQRRQLFIKRDWGLQWDESEG